MMCRPSCFSRQCSAATSVQDLIAHKQKRAAQQAGQQPSRLPRLAPKTQQQPSDATNRHAALVASRHSTSAAHVTIPQHAPGLAAATAVAAANPAADNPAGQQAKRNGNPAAALVTSADDLLTGQLAAATAASTALPKAPKATMPHSKTDSATLKQDFLQHLATRPVARACVSGRSSVDDLMMAAASSSAQETSAEAAAVAPVGSSQTTSGLVGTNRPRSVQHRIHVTQQQVMQHRGVMFHDGTDCENTPLRMQYSTSGSSGTRSSTSSWQTTSTVSAMQYCSGGLASQYSSAQLPYTTAEQSPLQLQGMPQQALRQIHSDGADAEGMRHAQQHQQPDFADDQGILEGGGACEEEVLRQSNDKLDMLLQSAVKQSRQALPGKENRSKQVCNADSLHVHCQPHMFGISEH